MKVLQICHKPPFPAIDGGCHAIQNITTGLLHTDIELKVLFIHTHKHKYIASEWPDEVFKKVNPEGVFVDTKLSFVDAYSNFVTQDSYNVSRFFTPDFNKALKDTLTREEFDIVHIESLFMTPYVATIKKYSKAKIVLRSHNLEFELWERIAFRTEKSFRKVYLKYLSRKIKQYELSVVNQVDGLAAITERDRKHYEVLGCNVPIITLPFGINLNRYKSNENETDQNSIFHLGAMDWYPNQEGLNWFLNQSWPRIHEKFKDLKFYVAGKATAEFQPDKSECVEIIGEVENATEFMNSKNIMLVPLLSGSGMRVKIIEGMALGKTIVSTSVGAEGIDVKHMENIVIANSPEEYSNAIEYLVEHPQESKLIGRNARQLVESKYDNSLLINELVVFYKQLINR